MKKILIMGLPGSGKTTLASNLVRELTITGNKVEWFNADDIRSIFNDWDFSQTGRLRQARRMHILANDTTAEYVIVDFVAPLAEMRTIFDPDFIIWVDTIPEGRFADTNAMFEPPDKYDCRVTEQDSVKWTAVICQQLELK